MQQTLPTYRDPRVAPYQSHYENPRYVAPIPAVDPWARGHHSRYQPPRPMRAPMPMRAPIPPSPPAPPRPLVQEFDFRPPRGRRPGLLIGAGVTVALVAIIVALTVVLLSSRDSASPSDPAMITAGNLTPSATVPPVDKQSETSTDEAELDQLVEDFRDAADIGPTSDWKSFYCSADRAIIEHAKVTTVIVPSKNFDRSSPLTDVEVTGKRARGELNGSMVKFRQEAGDWKFCMTG